MWTWSGPIDGQEALTLGWRLKAQSEKLIPSQSETSFALASGEDRPTILTFF